MVTTTTDTTEPYIFVSYASADRERVLPVVAALQAAAVAVWFDQADIGGGTNYGLEIAEGIERCAAFVLLCSAASLASRNVKQEIQLAWKFERPYLPLLLEPVAIPKDVAYWLEGSQWIEVLDKLEAAWLPSVLTALAPLGIVRTPAQQDAIRLAGRGRELALLREKLTAAQEGMGGLVLIGGEAGIGKTTLAEAVLQEAAGEGFVVLEGHCFDLAETPPYGPWIDLFARYQPSRSSSAVPAAFAQRGTVGAVASQIALFVQVQDFLTALGRQRPVALLLDDVQWSDPASLDLLRFLARSLTDLPLLILVTYRSDELTRRHPLYQLLPQLAREAGAARIDLGRLDDAAVQTLVVERYGLADDETVRLVTYVQRRAEGNALFVGELLRALEETGALRQEGDDWRLGDLSQTAIPALLRQVIDGRLTRMDDESQRLLAIAAVIGHDVPLAVWATVGEVDEDALLAVAEEGLEAHLLVEGASGERVRFAHALIRESLFEGIPAIRRRRIHRRIGEALTTLTYADPDAVAYHFQQAGDDRALPWLLESGERAQAAYAWTTAGARFEAALALMERADVDAEERGWLLMRLSRLLGFVEVAKCRTFVDEAVALAIAANAGALTAIARFRRGLLACFAGDVVYGLPEMEVGATALSALSDAERRDYAEHATAIAASRVPEGRGTVVLWRSDVGQFHEARKSGERLVAGVARSEGEIRHRFGDVGDGHYGLGNVYAALGMPDEATAMYARSHSDYLQAGNYALASNAATREVEMVALPYRAEDIAERQRLAGQAEAEWVRASGAVPATVPPLFVRLSLLVVEGQWEQVERVTAAVSAEKAGMTIYAMMALRYLAPLARLRGDAERAWWAIREGLPGGTSTEPGTIMRFEAATTLQRVAAALALDAGDLPTAKEWLDAHDRWLAWSGAVLGQSEGQALWAQYHRQAGDSEQAHIYAERALAHAIEPRQPLALIAAHRLLGELGTDAGRFADAATHLDASFALADACQAPYERALTLLAMAELRAATGDTTLARTFLNEVRVICDPLGAKPALARAAALAARLEAR